MIIKVIQPRRGKARIERTVRYILSGKQEYERVREAWTTNTVTNDPADAEYEMLAVTKTARRREDNVYHLVVSFSPDERELTLEELQLIETRICDALGYGTHQRVCAFHMDKEHPHLHIAICKVDPVTLNTITPFRAYEKLGRVRDELAEELDLSRVSQNKTHEKYSRQNYAKSRTEAFTEWLKDIVAPHIIPALKSGEIKDWQELQKRLGEYGVSIQKRGAGLVFSHTDEKLFVKASSVHRIFSFKSLQDRLGLFEKNKQKNAGPKQQFTSSDRKYREEYEEVRRRNAEIRKQKLREMYEEKRQTLKDLAAKYAQLRKEVKESDRSRQDKIAHYAELRLRRIVETEEIKAGFQVRREEIYTSHRFTFRDFLKEKAAKGDTEALRLLRKQAGREKDFSKNRIFAEDGNEESIAAIITETGFYVNNNGSVVYKMRRKEAVLDAHKAIYVSDPEDKKAVKLAVALAVSKYGNALKVEGSEKFQAAVREAAKTQLDRNFTINGVKMEPNSRNVRSQSRERGGVER